MFPAFAHSRLPASCAADSSQPERRWQLGGAPAFKQDSLDAETKQLVVRQPVRLVSETCTASQRSSASAAFRKAVRSREKSMGWLGFRYLSTLVAACGRPASCGALSRPGESRCGSPAPLRPRACQEVCLRRAEYVPTTCVYSLALSGMCSGVR